MEQHPGLGEKVVLRDPAGREFTTRVDDLGTGLVVVVQPHDLPADEVFANGAPLTVSWADENGDITLLPTKILAAHGDDAVQLWSLVVTGPAEMAQRRRFERVEVEGAVSLRPPGAADEDVVPANLVDVSEAALRCGVETGTADRFLGERNAVVAEFRLGKVDFAIPGRVEFVRATKQPTEVEDLVVMFDDAVNTARLRKQLFAEQARAAGEASTHPAP